MRKSPSNGEGAHELEVQRKQNQKLVGTLETQKQAKLTELYRTNPGKEPEKHKRLEGEYNDLERQKLAAEGKEKDFKYKRDVRHEFEYGEYSNRRGTRVEYACGPLNDPDDVINWRKTDVGAQQDDKLRREIGKSEGRTVGDDAGHRVALSFGTDPAEKRNIAPQNFQQNQGGGTWHDREKDLAQFAREHRGQSHTIEVSESYNTSRHDGERPFYRSVKVRESKGNEVGPPSVAHSNPEMAHGRERIDAKPDPAQIDQQAVKERRHLHLAEPGEKAPEREETSERTESKKARQGEKKSAPKQSM